MTPPQRIDREAYDKLVEMEDTLQRIIGNHPSPMMTVAWTALKHARDELRPTVWIDDSTINGQPTQHIKQVYPPCSSDTRCHAAGKWGATGVMPHGHVLVRWKNGAWLAHLREH
jgi:hypothetical protein